MKNYLKTLLFVFAAAATWSCTSEGDTELPPIAPAVFSENFTRTAPEQFNFENWTVFAEAGTKNWFKNAFGGNDYIEFSSFGSGQASNIGWAISPAFNIDETVKKRLIFQSAQHHATSEANKFEVLVSSDYDGTNVLAATWTVFNFRKPTYTNATNYDFVGSGPIDLSAYSGNIYIAFRVTGDGLTNSELDGGFQIDNIKLF